MSRSCLDGYLTKKCHDCSDWFNGNDGRGYGCATKYPIMECPHFKEMYEINEALIQSRLLTNILELKKDGLANKLISEILKVSEEEVKLKLNSIYGGNKNV